MKKVRRFSYERFPAFIVYLIAASCIAGCFVAGRHCLFVGLGYLLLGRLIDPKSSLSKND